MENELIDWLDSTGKTIGTVDKSVAHKKGLWHKSVHLWIFNTRGEVLLQKRCAAKKFYPNFWDVSVAGHVGAGENTALTAVREAKEEIGLTLKQSDLKFAFTFPEQLRWNNIISNEFVDVYVLVKNISANNLRFQAEEVADAKFFAPNAIFGSHLNENIFPHTEEYKLLQSYLKTNNILKEVTYE